MAFQVIPQSTFASGVGANLGKGLSQGLSEQLPKEIERIRLSQGLKGLESDVSQGNLTPFQQISKLAAIPGMDMQKIGALLPYIQQLQSRQALAQKAGANVPMVQQSQPTQQVSESAKRGSLRQRMEASDFAMPRNDQQIYQRANELAQLNANLTEQEAIAQAQAEDARRVQADEAVRGKANEVDNEFNRLTSAYLQKSGNEKFADIIGEMQGDYLSRARDRALDEGISPFTAGKQAAEDLLNFAKARQELRTNRAALFYTGKSGDKVLKDIQNVRPEYEKRGQLENLRNDLINYHGLSPEEADRLAYPVSKEEKQYIGALPRTTRSKLGMRSIKELSSQQVREIANKMSKQDSPRSIAIALMEKGYDGSDFIEKMKQYRDENPNDFTPRQSRDLTSFSERPTLGDIQLFGYKRLIDNWRLRQ